MAQISLPFRIALVAIALLGAVWFVALRPKAEPSAAAPLPAAPGVSGLSTATGKATAATKAAEKSAERAEAAAAAAESATPAAKASVTATATKNGATAEKSVTKAAKVAPAKPAARSNPAAPLLAALDRGRVVVLLFRNGSSDSASVAAMVRQIGERRTIVARVVSIKDVGKYQTFTAGTPVTQAPTTMVIGPRRNAELIVGFTSPGEIAQAAADVRRAGRKAS